MLAAGGGHNGTTDANTMTDCPNTTEHADRLWAELQRTCAAAEVSRVQGLLDVWSGEREPTLAPMQSMVKRVFVPDLPTAPWLDPRALSFIDVMQGLYRPLKQRLTAAMQEGEVSFRPYGVSPDAPEDAPAIPTLPKGWKQLLFYDGHRHALIDKNVRMFPEISTLIDAVLASNTMIQELEFLVLDPGARIGPHTDIENYFVTCQMGIAVPQRCGIRAGDEARRWIEGECLLFDNSFTHEVWNDDPQHPRIVLSLSTMHPNLTAVERQAIRIVRTHFIESGYL